MPWSFLAHVDDLPADQFIPLFGEEPGFAELRVLLAGAAPGRGPPTGGGVVGVSGTGCGGVATDDMNSPPRFTIPSTLPQDQIDDPAAADVDLLRVAAVVQDVVAVAPGVLERVGQDRHRREVPRLVHPAGDGHGRGRAPLRRRTRRGGTGCRRCRGGVLQLRAVVFRSMVAPRTSSDWRKPGDVNVRLCNSRSGTGSRPSRLVPPSPLSGARRGCSRTALSIGTCSSRSSGSVHRQVCSADHPRADRDTPTARY